jgi:hypothetical protein
MPNLDRKKMYDTKSITCLLQYFLAYSSYCKSRNQYVRSYNRPLAVKEIYHVSRFEKKSLENLTVDSLNKQIKTVVRSGLEWVIICNLYWDTQE